METVCKNCGEVFSGKKQTGLCSPDCKAAHKKQYMYRYYRANHPKALAGQKRYYEDWKAANPGKHYYGTEYRLYYGARDRCKHSGVEFAITVSDIIVPDLCPILGVKMIRGGRYAPSIDRINSNKGYTPDNIWVISKLANRMKNDASSDELERFGHWAIRQSKL